MAVKFVVGWVGWLIFHDSGSHGCIVIACYFLCMHFYLLLHVSMFVCKGFIRATVTGHSWLSCLNCCCNFCILFYKEINNFWLIDWLFDYNLYKILHNCVILVAHTIGCHKKAGPLATQTKSTNNISPVTLLHIRCSDSLNDDFIKNFLWNLMQ